MDFQSDLAMDAASCHGVSAESDRALAHQWATLFKEEYIKQAMQAWSPPKEVAEDGQECGDPWAAFSDKEAGAACGEEEQWERLKSLGWDEWHQWTLQSAAWHDFMLAHMASAWLPPPPVDGSAGLGQAASSSPMLAPLESPQLPAALLEPPPGLEDVEPFCSDEAATPAFVGVHVETIPDGSQHVHWAANARILGSMDKSAVSPEFKVFIPRLGLQPFRLVLLPAASGAGRGGSSFRRARGRGRVELTCKCQAGLQDAMPRLAICFSIGEKELAQPIRGPVLHSFADQVACGLPQEEELFDFSKAVQEDKTFAVRLSIVAASG